MKLTHTVGPHQEQSIHTHGKPLAEAAGVMILVHGRGATAQSILTLADELSHPKLAYLAPQAAGNTWYPYSFLAPLENNEPYLSSALAAIDDVVTQVEAAGISADKLILAGFSQGACLATEYVARKAKRYGGLLVYSGGLIGLPNTPREYLGDLAGTPIFLGCSDVDFHIPKERVLESEAVLRDMGAEVTAKLYPNMGHTINQDEFAHGREILNTMMV